MRNILITGLILLVFGCSSKSASEFTTVKVKEVEQVSGYTYLLVKAKGPEYWVAVSSREASPGDTYHYKGGLPMENFYSRELDRTFEEILFLDEIVSGEITSKQIRQGVTPGSTVTREKSDISVETVEGAISIAELFENPKLYEGKKIKVNGEVTKYNAAIMDLNWVHLQDGTEYEGKFDLTATSSETFEVGSTIVLEGVVALNKDFGYGYSYEILLEEATAVK